MNAFDNSQEIELELFARCAGGLEHVLAQELKDLGAKRVRSLTGGVAFFGSQKDVYQVCLWSRIATRIQLVLVRVDASDAHTLYQDVRSFAWEHQIGAGATIAVRAHGQNANLRNSQFTALKVKDAVCDRLRDVYGRRPSIDTVAPDVSLDVSLNRNRATLYLNLSGASLHRRSYRQDGVQGAAPLKETLAAGMLYAAGFRSAAFASLETSVGFVDPMCGTGTLAIEAALIAADIAPGLLRKRWGFDGWAQHDITLWECVRAEAQKRRATGVAVLANLGACLFAGDCDSRAVELAQANAQRAGVDNFVEFYVCDAADLVTVHVLTSHSLPTFGLLATNPPYGQRMLSSGGLSSVYAALGTAIEALPRTWDVAIITPDANVDTAISEVPTELLACYNGPIQAAVRLYRNRQDRIQLPLVSLGGREHEVLVADPGSEQFAARLRKVAKERAKWARKEGVSCYRIYDADLPDFALSVDLFQTCNPTREASETSSNPAMYARIVEYQAPAHIDPLLANRRFMDALTIVPALFDLDTSNVFSKIRKRAKGGGQYIEARGESNVVLIEEAGYVFELDLGGYLDTGLFLDHRETRTMVGHKAKHTRFLNLFAYTGTASVYAAGGGATCTTTVDLSHTYLDWARRNMQRNGFSGQTHTFVHADVMEWLRAEAHRGAAYDLVFCDPPTFSNSKAAKHSFDVQRDHVGLLSKIARILASDGTIIFSCNLRTFKMDTEALSDVGLVVEDITAETIPHDFVRTPKIHHCYLVHIYKESDSV